VKHSARAQVHLQVIVVLPFLLSVHYLLLLTCHGKLDQLLCLLHAAVDPQLLLAMRLLLNPTLGALACEPGVPLSNFNATFVTSWGPQMRLGSKVLPI